MPLAASAVARQAPTGKPPPSAFAMRHDVGRDAGVLIGEQLAGAADAGLHFVEDQQAGRARRTVCAMRAGNACGTTRTPPSPMTGSIRMAAVSGPMAFLVASRSANGTWSKPGDRRTEAVEIFLVAGGGERGQRAAVERAFEGDDAVALRLAVGRLIFARHLDRALDRLGAGIPEEHGVGEGRRAQPLGQPFAFRNAVQIRDVPDLCAPARSAPRPAWDARGRAH